MWTSLPERNRGIPAWPPKVGSPEQAVEDRVPEADWRVSPAQLVTVHREDWSPWVPREGSAGSYGGGGGSTSMHETWPPEAPVSF